MLIASGTTPIGSAVVHPIVQKVRKLTCVESGAAEDEGLMTSDKEGAVTLATSVIVGEVSLGLGCNST